jgi:hypothetical protein
VSKEYVKEKLRVPHALAPLNVLQDTGVKLAYVPPKFQKTAPVKHLVEWEEHARTT